MDTQAKKVQSVLSSPLPITGDKGKAILKDYASPYLLVYFYPKDDTPGCTVEGQEFSGLNSQFQSKGVFVCGVSRDTLASHEKFKAKYNYAIELVSDEDGKLCEAFGVLKEKTMFGKTRISILRSTFLLDSRLSIIKQWDNVKAKGHAGEVLEFVKGLS